MTVDADAPVVHGPWSYVNRGCRCEVCSDAHRAYCTSWRDRRQAERVLVDGRLVHPRAPHGTTGGYHNYGCRCVRCTEARRDRERVARDRARGVPA